MRLARPALFAVPALVLLACASACSGKSKAKPADEAEASSTREPVVVVRTPLINKGPLKAKAVVDELETQTDELVECYRAGLKGDPGLAGTVLVTFDVNPDGSVEGTRLAGSRLRDTATERCVVNQSATLDFPATDGGETSTVTVPFLLVEFDPNAAPLPQAPATASSQESAPTPPGRG